MSTWFMDDPFIVFVFVLYIYIRRSLAMLLFFHSVHKYCVGMTDCLSELAVRTVIN